MEKLKEKLFKAQNQGNLLEIIYEINNSSDNVKQTLNKALISLHNESKINIIAELRKSSLRLKGNDFFFSNRLILEEVLPEIVAPVDEVMDCVRHLYIEAGNDIAASWIFEAFKKYCEVDQLRSKNALQIIEISVEKWLCLIIPVITSGSKHQASEFLSKAILFTQHENINVRLKAIFAIGKINYDDNSVLLKKALESLKNIVNHEDDCRLLSQAMNAVYSLYVIDEKLKSEIIQIFKKILTKNDEIILNTTSEIFRFQNIKIPEELLDIILEALKNINHQNTTSLVNIDYGLHKLLELKQEEKVILFLEYVLLKNEKYLSIGNFSSAIRDILNNNQLLSKLVTRWFLSKNISLGKAIGDLFMSSHSKDIQIIADKDLLTKQPEGTCLFVVKKVIGWLFNRPISCISFIISIIDIANENEIDEISKLIFNPLLISFPGRVPPYLIKNKSNCSPKTQIIIDGALNKFDNFQSDIKAAIDIPELLPSQTHQEIYSRYFNQKFEDSLKTAQKNSIINKIASKSVLLYGHKSIDYIQDPNNDLHRVEIPLKSFEHSIEIPNLEYLDPFALDYMAVVFRLEGCCELK